MLPMVMNIGRRPTMQAGDSSACFQLRGVLYQAVCLVQDGGGLSVEAHIMHSYAGR